MDFTPIENDTVLKIDNLYTIHYFEYAKDYAFYGERHDFWEMVYIDSGEAGIVADTSGYTLSQGYAAFHKPWEYHNIWANKKFANSVVITFASQSESMNFFKNKILFFDEESKYLLSKILAEAKNYFEEPLNIVDLKKMTKQKNAPFGGEQMIRRYLEELLIHLIRAGHSAIPSKSDSLAAEEGQQKIVDSVISFLKDNIENPITLDNVVENIAFSKTYLKALFRKKTGSTIMKYLTRLRMDRARQLLSDGNFTVSEISGLCGFSTVHYFSNTFKKETGMTPTEYAKTVGSMGIL